MLFTVAILTTNSIAIVLAEGINPSSSYSNMHNNWSINRWVGWKYTTSGGIVSSVQATCCASGFNPGPIAGYYGTNTQNTIIGFQNREGLM